MLYGQSLNEQIFLNKILCLYVHVEVSNLFYTNTNNLSPGV